MRKKNVKHLVYSALVKLLIFALVRRHKQEKQCLVSQVFMAWERMKAGPISISSICLWFTNKDTPFWLLLPLVAHQAKATSNFQFSANHGSHHFE